MRVVWICLVLCACAGASGGEEDGPPVEVDGSSLTVGDRHTCRLDADSAAWCWGQNDLGQLGIPKGEPSLVPVKVSGDHRFVHLSAGTNHTCGLTAAEEIWCWGHGGQGQLGHGGRPLSQPEPVRVEGGLSWKTVSAGGQYTCGVTLDDVAWCWGEEGKGQLGEDTEFGLTTRPLLVSGGLRFRTVAAGNRHSCGLDPGGKAWCWGDNIGRGNAPASQSIFLPKEVLSTLSFEQIWVGVDFTCAIGPEQQAFCWGTPHLGAPTHDPLLPFPVDGERRWAQLSVGLQKACGRTVGGRAFCWNGTGVDGSSASQAYLTEPVPANLRVKGIMTSGYHTCALDTAGKTWCWGRNAEGQLGVGDTTDRAMPVEVP